jgi:hypothetical protein
MKRLALALAFVPAVAAAEPDLRLRREPATLHMRARRPQVAAAAPLAAPQAEAKFEPVPTTARDLAERVIVRVRAGYEIDRAPSSGQPFVGGDALPARFSDSRPWILGEAVVGARDILLPSLGAYMLSSFQLDAGSSLPSRTALVVPGDATDQRVAIKAGYAEYGTEDKDPGQHLWLRAGRQYRLDDGAMFAYFDGATVGWKEPAWNVSAFAGSRVALYVDTPTGIEAGATAQVDVAKLTGTPLKVAADVMSLSIENQLRSLVALSASSDVTQQAHLDVRLRAIDSGSGIGFGRLDTRLRWTPRREIVVIADAEQRSGGDVAYDLAAPSAVDVVEVAQKLGVGLAAPTAATVLGARADYHKPTFEVLAFGRMQIAEGTTTSVDQQGWAEAGAAYATLVRGMWTTAQYTLRQYLLDAAANMPGSSFDDTSGSGITRLHELAFDTTYRAPATGGRRWRVGGGLFYRLYSVQSPYAAIANDGRAGGRVHVQWWLSRALHAELAGDVAQPDPVLQRELGALMSLRGAVEAQW